MLDNLKEKWPEILDYLKKEYDIQDITFETIGRASCRERV